MITLSVMLLYAQPVVKHVELFIHIIFIRSNFISNSTEICSPGSYSKKGLAPCSLCPVGTYQNTDGMTRCDTCPSGQTTAMQGSTSQAACQGRIFNNIGHRCQSSSIVFVLGTS